MTNELLIVNATEQLLVATQSQVILETVEQGPPGPELEVSGTGYLHYTNGVFENPSTILQIAEGANQGIQVEGEWGWRDLIGTIQIHGMTYNDPSIVSYGGTNIRQYQFSGMDMNEICVTYHIPHDYVPNTPFHIHMHWSNGEEVQSSGDVVWTFEILYAKGHSQESFNAAGTYSAIQTNPEVQFKHMIAETSEITIVGLEVDGLLLVRAYRNTLNVLDTCIDPVFGHMVDLHYRSNSSATKNKAPNFYV